mmetsp:Transcript_18061/g.54347  ORF Transcript_18061/g.54347 Transcript_18061/m.54347 type:complete len:224 (+) Transcript_18061:2545-3216(+)
MSVFTSILPRNEFDLSTRPRSRNPWRVPWGERGSLVGRGPSGDVPRELVAGLPMAFAASRAPPMGEVGMDDTDRSCAEAAGSKDPARGVLTSGDSLWWLSSVPLSAGAGDPDRWGRSEPCPAGVPAAAAHGCIPPRGEPKVECTARASPPLLPLPLWMASFCSAPLWLLPGVLRGLLPAADTGVPPMANWNGLGGGPSRAGRCPFRWECGCGRGWPSCGCNCG